jgi:hypothetical protein
MPAREFRKDVCGGWVRKLLVLRKFIVEGKRDAFEGFGVNCNIRLCREQLFPPQAVCQRKDTLRASEKKIYPNLACPSTRLLRCSER